MKTNNLKFILLLAFGLVNGLAFAKDSSWSTVEMTVTNNSDATVIIDGYSHCMNSKSFQQTSIAPHSSTTFGPVEVDIMCVDTNYNPKNPKAYDPKQMAAFELTFTHPDPKKFAGLRWVEFTKSDLKLALPTKAHYPYKKVDSKAFQSVTKSGIIDRMVAYGVDGNGSTLTTNWTLEEHNRNSQPYFTTKIKVVVK